MAQAVALAEGRARKEALHGQLASAFASAFGSIRLRVPLFSEDLMAPGRGLSTHALGIAFNSRSAGASSATTAAIDSPGVGCGKQ